MSTSEIYACSSFPSLLKERLREPLSAAEVEGASAESKVAKAKLTGSHRYREFLHDIPLSWYLWSLRRMAYTPTSSTRRIPTPARHGLVSGLPAASGIPTPGRSRAGSTVATATPIPPDDSPNMTRALTDAIRANDPKQHRIAGQRPSENSLSPHSSPSSYAASLPASGRRSVARPSNINVVTAPRTVSSASAASSSAPRVPLPKTPTSSAGAGSAARPAFTPRASTSTATSRPESRQEVRSKKDRTFEPGDAVRIESLGMEGTLRFLGPIEGKPGVWAGVELVPALAGRGKNDGTVNGVSYFTCPPKCGVFVASAKLSAPIFRPSSVASSRGRTTPSLPPVSGRTTPGSSFSTSGRATPALPSSGRVTPARSTSGRITPSFTTPNARPRPSIAAAGTTPGAKPRKSTVPEPSFSAGSRASRYIGMTAQQLQDAKNGNAVDAEQKRASPTRLSAPPPSPFATPKAPGAGRPSGVGISTPGNKPRQSVGGFGFGTGTGAGTGTGTPRSGRRTDMPPPPSPVSPSKRLLASSPSMRLTTTSSPSRRLTTPTSPSRRLITPTESEYADERDGESEPHVDLAARNRELQERIASLTSGRPVNGIVSRAPTPSVGVGVTSTEVQALLEAKAALEAKAEREAKATLEAKTALEESKTRATTALARVSELETQVRFNERAVKERESRIEALERSLKGKDEDVDKARLEGEARVRELSGKLEDSEALVGSLKAAVEEVREGKKEETEAIIGAKNKEIELLSAKAARAAAELEEERRELGSQIDELRLAGQETIALYEEKLNEADGKRWEMEDLVHSLEDKLRKQKRSLSPATIARHTSEAAQIDNEMLKEQVLHFERKVSQLESQLDGAREAADKEEQAMRVRIAKYKENDVALKKELAEVRAEVDHQKRLEAAAKARLEELEEALRENAVALENARAEIEGLRTELAHLEGLQAGAEAANGVKAEDDAARRAAERARLTDEIAQLKDLLESSRTSRREALEQCESARREVDAAKRRADSMESTVHALENDKAELERTAQDKSAKLTVERKTVASLKQDLDARLSELEQLRKNANRDLPLSPATHRESMASISSRSRHEHPGEEIAGLKHIIQELNKENLEITARIKLVESDKRLLQEECNELREAMRMLESNVDEELRQLEGDAPGSEVSGDVQKALREAKAKHELELGQLRQKSLEAEQKHAQSIRDLNKEVSELESLVEAKIYREDDLERELERYKDKLARASQRKLSKASGESAISLAPPSVTSESSIHPDRALDGDVCEICEQPGHDIFSCHLLKDDIPSLGRSSRTETLTDSEPADLWCEDCESHGHTAADCPHSMDVF
ncbi:hypothetical protein K439DRAFT_1657108 [Ramaria rubella]|nr:hypothetical protein K439DRAFT_1657108 [Ramaria rubella]